VIDVGSVPVVCLGDRLARGAAVGGAVAVARVGKAGDGDRVDRRLGAGAEAGRGAELYARTEEQSALTRGDDVSLPQCWTGRVR
jgi:hypothetical protein